MESLSQCTLYIQSVQSYIQCWREQEMHLHKRYRHTAEAITAGRASLRFRHGSVSEKSMCQIHPELSNYIWVLSQREHCRAGSCLQSSLQGVYGAGKISALWHQCCCSSGFASGNKQYLATEWRIQKSKFEKKKLNLLKSDVHDHLMGKVILSIRDAQCGLFSAKTHLFEGLRK